MQKWEYRIERVELKTDEDIQLTSELINRMGDVGWELVTTASNQYYPALIFKRPKQ
jgi:hypothetical protein